MLAKLFAHFPKASLSFLFKEQENSCSCCTVTIMPLAHCWGHLILASLPPPSSGLCGWQAWDARSA